MLNKKGIPSIALKNKKSVLSNILPFFKINPSYKGFLNSFAHDEFVFLSPFKDNNNG